MENKPIMNSFFYKYIDNNFKTLMNMATKPGNMAKCKKSVFLAYTFTISDYYIHFVMTSPKDC